ncbi:DUF3696 domain-containing protein [Streptomyces sp. BI20]|uniref:DUF3696 domain-containing protein n=1 Tax=Streptomyces sp. BI20 TaxID=3403460 RepID=UPI003C75ECCD
MRLLRAADMHKTERSARVSLEKFSLENYRCFRDRQEVELGRITVVLGRNNSGKSAVVRSLPILASGFSTDSPYPLDLNPVQGPAPLFTDLIHGSSPHGRIGLGVEVLTRDDRVITVDANIQNIADHRIQLVSELQIAQNGQRRSFSWVPGPDAYFAQGRTYHDGKDTCRMTFRGLLPDGGGSFGFVSDAGEVTELVRESFDEVRYQGPLREVPRRFFQASSRASRTVGHRGERALSMLAAHEADPGRMVEEVNRLLESMLPGWRLALTDLGSDIYMPRLHSTRNPDLFVHIDDVGTGVIQFLPLLVQRAADRVNPPAMSVIEVVEEPELHLHPSAHASIADLYIDAAQNSSVRFMVETHSENFLLRLRRRVAEGRLAPEDLKVYFVEQVSGSSQLRKIEVDRLGNIDYWPAGVFSEDFEEIKALAHAQVNRARDEG